MMLKNIFLVGLGGSLGCALRYLTSLLVHKYDEHNFLFATCIVNMIGCFAIGCIIGLLHTHFPSNSIIRPLLITGFCGGYTTFSAFAYENLTLIQSGQIGIALLYVLVSVVTGVVAVWGGVELCRYL